MSSEEWKCYFADLPISEITLPINQGFWDRIGDMSFFISLADAMMLSGRGIVKVIIVAGSQNWLPYASRSRRKRRHPGPRRAFIASPSHTARPKYVRRSEMGLGVVADVVIKVIDVVLFAYALSTLIKAWQRKTIETWMYWFVATGALKILTVAVFGVFRWLFLVAFAACFTVCVVLLLRAWRALKVREREIEEIEAFCTILNDRFMQIYDISLENIIEDNVDSKEDNNDACNN